MINDFTGVTYITWPDVISLVKKIQEYCNSEFKYDTILTIQRGGLVPATVLAHFAGVKNIQIINVRRSKTDDIMPEWQEPEISENNNINVTEKKVLVIDDIIGTGKSMNKVREFLRLKGASEFKFTALVINKNRFRDTAPDFVAREVTDWIIFPWEVNIPYRGVNVSNLQKWCLDLEKSTGMRSDLELLGEFSQEVGEAVRSVLTLQNIKVRKKEDNLGKECFDLLYNLAVIAAKHDINLEEEFIKAINKYEARFEKNIWNG